MKESKGLLGRCAERTLAELKKMPEVKAIYLFGSQAKGLAKPMSDTDLCVIAGKNTPESKKFEILSNSSDFVDVSVFWDLPVSIKGSVLRDGKLLYCRDKAFLDSVLASTMDEFLDFKPVLEKFTKLYAGA